MEMGKDFAFQLLLTLSLGQCITGLTFFLEPDPKILPNGKIPCGVLQCLETSNVSSITVYKKTLDRRDGRSHVTVASASPHLANGTRESQGILVEETWSPQRAEALLYLVQADDCFSAEFSCEVKFRDGRKQHMILTHNNVDGLARYDQRLSSSTGDSLTANALQLSAMIHAMDSRELDRLDNNIRDFERRIEDRIYGMRDHMVELERMVGRTPNAYNSNGGHTTDQLRVELSNMSISLADVRQAVINLQKTMVSIDVQSSYNDQFNVTVSTIMSHLETRIRSILVSFQKGLQPVTDSTIGDLPTEMTETAIGEPSLVCRQNDTQSVTVTQYHVVNSADDGAPYLCDSMSQGGGWIVIQRRSTGLVDFYQDWDTYKQGFGSLDNDFWLGNEKIHALTSDVPYELLVTVQYGGRTTFAYYDSFSIEGEEDNYRLRLGSYHGTAGDSLDHHRNMRFSTKDRDHDMHSTFCAQVYHGAWWYNACHNSNLNGEWGSGNDKGLSWRTFSSGNSVTYSELKIRAK